MRDNTLFVSSWLPVVITQTDILAMLTVHQLDADFV